MRITRAYLVVPEGAVVLGGYTGPRGEMLADEHRRCATGTVVIPIELLEVRLPSIADFARQLKVVTRDEQPCAVDIEPGVGGELVLKLRRLR